MQDVSANGVKAAIAIDFDCESRGVHRAIRVAVTEATTRKFARGLDEVEVAVIKRMRSLGMPRDYVMSFIIEPGRIVSPAAVDEVAQGKIGQDVPPASLGVVETYVQERLAAVQAVGRARFQAPTSPWRVQQVLLWARPDQSSLLPSEGYEVDFKIIFNSDDRSCFKYLKTLAAFANHRGGHIFFGIDDLGNVVEFERERFLNYDWERFDQILQQTSCLTCSGNIPS